MTDRMPRWLRDAIARAWRNARQTALPILLLAYQTGQLTGVSSARALAAGVGTAVTVTTGRLILGELAGLRTPADAPAWRALLARAVSAAAVPVVGVWPLDWAGFHGVSWQAIGWASLLAAVLSLLDRGADHVDPTVTVDDVQPEAVDEPLDDPEVTDPVDEPLGTAPGTD